LAGSSFLWCPAAAAGPETSQKFFR